MNSISFLEENSQTIYMLDEVENKTSSNKLAIYDLDHTLIKPKKGRFPLNKDDWTWAFPNILEILFKNYNDGYRIIVISNQSRINMDDMKYKLESIYNSIKKELINISIEFYVAMDKSIYRKPMTGIYKMLLEEKETHHPDSFYCGDAAGRKGDFNITDRYFAENCGLDFRTPEEVFLGRPKQEYKDIYKLVDFETFFTDTEHPMIETSEKNVVMIIGLDNKLKEMLLKGGYKEEGDKKFTENKILLVNPSSFKNYVKSAVSKGYKVYVYKIDIPSIIVKHLNQTNIHMSSLIRYENSTVKQINFLNELKDMIEEVIEIKKIYGIFTEGFKFYYGYKYDVK